MTPAGRCAEAIVASLGIARAADLDVEALAFDSGLEVVYDRLRGCEATLVGFGDRAMATVNRSSVRGRERFSIAHELGHWQLHRGRSFQCRVDEPDTSFALDRTIEREADDFASHLLMPGPIFNPLVRTIGKPRFEDLADLAREFETSLTATALRLAAINTLLVIVACYDRDGRRWCLAADDIPRWWRPKRQLDEATFTYDLLHKGVHRAAPGKQPADAWFDNDGADRFEVIEQCSPSRAGQALVLLYLPLELVEARLQTEKPSWQPGRRASNWRR